jgi:hypothetical protein
MTKEQAIELARAKKRQFAGIIRKLRPFPTGGDRWAIAVWITPLVAWNVLDVEQFDADLDAIEAAFSEVA